MSRNNGRQGEQLFYQAMAQNGYGVEDVSNNPCYWEKDIDFIITSPFTGAVKSFEVKWDSRISSTNNLYLELSSAHSKGGKGWYKFCEADYLAYGDAVNKVFYIISFPELKERVKGLPQRYANCGDDSTGLLVSIGAIKDLV